MPDLTEFTKDTEGRIGGDGFSFGLARTLLEVANVVLPTIIAHNREVNVHTKTKLKSRR